MREHWRLAKLPPASAPYTELSLNAQTAYAQLLDATLAASHLRSVADLPGSFAAKTVKGHKYWYYQYTEPSGKLRQVFVGPDGDPLRRLMQGTAKPAAGASLAPLARAAIALGCAEILPRHLLVLRRLAEYGFFRSGGVLVGTHAFIAYANMLGVRWGESARTQDMDFAHAGRNVALLLPSDIEVRTHDAIESLRMGFLPVTGLSSRAGASYLNAREPAFRLDFLTTLHRGGEAPYEHPKLHVTLQPLKFMEFSLEQVQQTVMMSGEAAVLANVPHPAQYAFHKLLVVSEREGSFQTKANKDLMQAGALLALLKERKSAEAREIWSDLLSRGRGWVGRAKRGLAMLDKALPQLDLRRWLKAQGVLDRRAGATTRPGRRPTGR